MEYNELESTIWLENLESKKNGYDTRAKKETYNETKRISYQGNYYSVPHATTTYATISSLSIQSKSAKDSYDSNSCINSFIGLNDKEASQFTIKCSHDCDEDDQDKIILSILLKGSERPINKYHLEGCFFAHSINLPMGDYLFIISGATMKNKAFNHDENYIILPFRVTSAHSQYAGIKSAKFSVNSPTSENITQPISFSIIHKTATKETEFLKALCIDSHMNVVSFKDIVFQEKSRSDMLSISPKGFWKEGMTYTLIIGDACEAISSMSFRYSENKRCLVRNYADIKYQCATYYKMLVDNCLLERFLYPTPYFSNIKEKVISLYGKRLHAQEFNRFAETDLLPTRYNLIVTSEHPHPIQQTNHPADFVNYCINFTDYNQGSSVEKIDCMKICTDNEWFLINGNSEVSIWYNISALSDNRGKALSHIIEYLINGHYVTLYDTPKEIKRFFNTFPEVAPLFDEQYTFVETAPTCDEIVVRFIDMLKYYTSCDISDKCISHIYNHIEMCAEEDPYFYRFNSDAIRLFANTHVISRVHKRILSNSYNTYHINISELKCIQPQDVDFSLFMNDNHLDIDTIMNELNEMVGLDNIKENVINLFHQLQFNKMRREMGLPATEYGRHHMLLTGNPGTGKTTVAKMMGKIFHSMGILSKGDVVVTNRSELVGTYIGQTEENVKEIIDASKGNILFIDEAYSLCDGNKESNDFGRHVIETLLPMMAEEQHDMIVILAGYDLEMKKLFDFNPGLKGRFTHQWHFNNYNADELMEIGCNLLKKMAFKLSDEAHNLLYATIKSQLNAFDPLFSNARWIKQLITNSILPAMSKRIINAHAGNDTEYYTTILPEDIESITYTNAGEIDLNKIMNDINHMVGLDTIKENITNLACQLQFNKKRHDMGFPKAQMSNHHMIFTGNPGTGKTTVAKMIGEIYHSMGILSRGEVIVTDRSKLVGSHIGQTEKNMRDTLEKAKGNVLFIDEAYSLCVKNKDDNDFGRHVIESLLPVLANDNSDMIVILAGYKDEMEKLFDLNSGLKGRFPHNWHFDNYSADELIQIGCNLLDKMSFKLSEEAHDLLLKTIQEELSKNDRHFSNARWIKQQIEHAILPAMSKRVMSTPDCDNAEYYATILPEDITAMEKRSSSQQPRRNRVGFCAQQMPQTAR